MKKKATKQFSNPQSKIINCRFKSELGGMQVDLTAAENRLNTFLGIFARRYGPAIGSHLPFFAITIRYEVDLITFVTWFAISLVSFFLIMYNYEWVEGKHGQIEYLGELSRKLNEARNKGLSIYEEDILAQDEWLEEYVEGDALKIVKEHPIHVQSPKLRNKIRICNWFTLILLAVAFVNFILNTLPILTPELENEAKEMGNFFGFLPNYIQGIYLRLFRPEVLPEIVSP